MNVRTQLILATLLLASAFGCEAVSYENSATIPPAPPREFRGVWVATVANIDWPSKPALTTAQQKAELITILDRAAQLNLNAIIFQVRPACDAMYASQIEPWSEYLTGTMGKAPEPYYDPLAFAIEEAHKRGMELHAWFNPYRARHFKSWSQASANHISRTRPNLVRSYGKYLWLDPGERDVQDYSLKVVMDVVKRYDVDGVQFDDYFYPDPAEVGINADFPDEASWKKFGAGGKLSKADWRRENVNTFIHRVYDSIKATKPWVKFGIAPFGIWRPGQPPQIRGKDAYSVFYADSRKWLMNGWVDYCAPQLYWKIDQKDQSFPVLLDWWAQQDTKGRHIWPGLSTSYSLSQSWPADEISNQIQLTRKQHESNGWMLYSAHNLFESPMLARKLQDVNSRPALIPASPWLASSTPAKPNVFAVSERTRVRLTWNPTGTNSVTRWWLVQTKLFGAWKTELLPAADVTQAFEIPPEVVAVTAIDRVGNASPPRVLQIRKNPSGERIPLKQ